MSQKEYIPGDTVFAKLKGYPWWPARVENDKDIPAKILKQKGKSKSLQYTVFFYGSRDYGFFGPDCVRPFDRATVERDLKAKKFKTKDLELAIHQALDPSILKAQEEAEAAALASEEEKSEALHEDEEDEEEEKIKPKKKQTKKPAATIDKKKKNQSATTKKRVSPAKRVIQEEDEDDVEEEVKDEDEDMKMQSATKKKVNTKKASTGEKNKRTRAVDGESENSNNDRKKRRKSLSLEQEEEERNNRESSTMSRNKSEEPNQTVGIAGGMDVESFKKTAKYKKVYQIRHKLQKLVYEKKPGEIKREDYSKISQVVKEIEDTEMTFDLLRYTKIGKVVKFACTYEYDNDEYKISQRCQHLMKSWKSLIVPETPRSASATASSSSVPSTNHDSTSKNNNQTKA